MDKRIRVPLRPNGTARRFFYDPVGGHVIHRRPDGTYEAIGFECRHEINPASVSE